MATIHSTDIIQTLLRNDGVFPGSPDEPDDPQALAIFAFVADDARLLYSVCYEQASETSLRVAQPGAMLLWRRGQGLTTVGGWLAAI